MKTKKENNLTETENNPVPDMNAIKSEPLPAEENFEKIIIPDVSVDIPGSSENTETSAQDIISDITNSGITPAEVPVNEEFDTMEIVSEQECTAMLHTVYGLVAFILNSETPPDETIVWRGKQMFIIMSRYHLQVKYMDLAFFGLGIASDIGMIYKARKIKLENKKENEPAPLPNNSEMN